jgi:hypothetical protein
MYTVYETNHHNGSLGMHDIARTLLDYSYLLSMTTSDNMYLIKTELGAFDSLISAFDIRYSDSYCTDNRRHTNKSDSSFMSMC